MFKFSKFYLFLIIINVNMVIMVKDSLKRPVYNIAHMVNTIKDVHKYLDRGANGIETDVNFTRGGSPVSTYHGSPCDCSRNCEEEENFPKYLKNIRDMTTLGSPSYKRQGFGFVLLQLDLKTSDVPASLKKRAGRKLARVVSDNLYERSPARSGIKKIKLLLSVESVSDSDIIIGFIEELEKRELNHLKDNIGFDVSLSEPIPKIRKMWEKLDGVKNKWQGDGSRNCKTLFRNSGRLERAIKERDGPKPYKRKVYARTIDQQERMRKLLRKRVDAIVTDNPGRLRDVLKEKEFADSHRLATQGDSPFERFGVKSEESKNYNQTEY